MLTTRHLRGSLRYSLCLHRYVRLVRTVVNAAGEVNESGGVLTFFIPAKLD